MLIEIEMEKNYNKNELMDEFKYGLDTQDSFIDSNIYTLSHGINLKTNIDESDIEFSDVLWKNSFFDIIEVNSAKIIQSFNFHEFAHIVGDEDEGVDEDNTKAFNVLVKQLEKKLNLFSNDSWFIIKIRFFSEFNDNEIKEQLIKENEL